MKSALLGNQSQPKKEETASPVLDYNVGDKVKHRKFGIGTILATQSMGKDMLLKISFEVGEKNLLAVYAPIEKV